MNNERHEFILTSLATLLNGSSNYLKLALYFFKLKKTAGTIFLSPISKTISTNDDYWEPIIFKLKSTKLEEKYISDNVSIFTALEELTLDLGKITLMSIDEYNSLWIQYITVYQGYKERANIPVVDFCIDRPWLLTILLLEAYMSINQLDSHL